jgi:hypothetical protein
MLPRFCRTRLRGTRRSYRPTTQCRSSPRHRNIRQARRHQFLLRRETMIVKLWAADRPVFVAVMVTG